MSKKEQSKKTMNASADLQTPNKVLSLWNRVSRYPGGQFVFSKAVSHKAPYFKTIHATIVELRPNFSKVVIKKRKSIQNHLGGVHVIAIANLLEMAMGVCAEASIPAGYRWIPKGMKLDYTAKAGTDIIGVAEIHPADWKPGDLKVKVTAFDENDIVVVEGYIKLWISEKPSASKR